MHFFFIMSIRAANNKFVTLQCSAPSQRNEQKKRRSNNNHKFNDETFYLFNETGNGAEIYAIVEMLSKDFRRLCSTSLCIFDSIYIALPLFEFAKRTDHWLVLYSTQSANNTLLLQALQIANGKLRFAIFYAADGHCTDIFNALESIPTSILGPIQSH